MKITTEPLQAVWSTVLVDCGELCATIGGVLLMLLSFVDNLD